eukprot:768427-Hanusia_phi.AAC.1
MEKEVQDEHVDIMDMQMSEISTSLPMPLHSVREEGDGREGCEMEVQVGHEEWQGQRQKLLASPSLVRQSAYSQEAFLTAGVWDVIREAYTLPTLRHKVYTTLYLRLCKGVALIVNEKVGGIMFGWKMHENRILDYIGRRTLALCHELYGVQESMRYVQVFLRRRFLYCIISTCVTTMQVGFQLVRLEVLAVLLSIVTMPITMVDRQLATLVTKTVPRAERSTAMQFAFEANDMFRKHFPALKKLPRARMHQHRCCNLTSLEMVVGFLQFVSAGIIVAFSFSVLLRRAAPFEILLMNDWCVRQVCLSMSSKVIFFRIIKEICNWISPWIEKTLTPHVSDQLVLSLSPHLMRSANTQKYAFNENVVRNALTNIHHAAGADGICRVLVESDATRMRCADLVEEFILCCKAGDKESRLEHVQVPSYFLRLRDAEEAMEVINLMMKAVECGDDVSQIQSVKLSRMFRLLLLQEHKHILGHVSLTHFHPHGQALHTHQANFVKSEEQGHIHLLEDGIKFWHHHPHGSDAHEHALDKTEQR